MKIILMLTFFVCGCSHTLQLTSERFKDIAKTNYFFSSQANLITTNPIICETFLTLRFDSVVCYKPNEKLLLTGVIIDNETNESFSNGSVMVILKQKCKFFGYAPDFVENCDFTVIDSVLSDSNGKFRLDVSISDNYYLGVRHTGGMFISQMYNLSSVIK